MGVRVLSRRLHALAYADGGTNRLTVGTPAVFTNMTAWSALVVLRRTAAITTTREMAFSKYSGFPGWSWWCNDQSMFHVFQRFSATSIQYTGVPTTPLNEWIVGCTILNHAAAAGQKARTWYARLEERVAEQTYTSTTDQAGTIEDDSTTDLCLGASMPAGGVASAPVDIAFAAMCPGVALTEAEVLRWAADPFGHRPRGLHLLLLPGDYSVSGAVVPDLSGHGHHATLSTAQSIVAGPTKPLFLRWRSRRRTIGFVPGPSCALSGTIASGTTEAHVVAGGRTVALTLSGDTWVAAGATFDAERQTLIDGCNHAALAGGLAVTDVARTSDTVVTITCSAIPGYNIASQVEVQWTVPGSALALGNPISASPSFLIDPTGLLEGPPVHLLGFGLLS